MKGSSPGEARNSTVQSHQQASFQLILSLGIFEVAPIDTGKGINVVFGLYILRADVAWR